MAAWQCVRVGDERESDPLVRLSHAVDEIARRTHDRRRIGVSHDDADGVDGTWATDDAIGFDPLPLLLALNERRAWVVVMGQVAGIMHGSTELTGDLDLLWDGNDAQADALAEAFASLSSEITDAEGRPVSCDRAAFLLPKVFFRTKTASGDLCTPRLPWGESDILSIISRASIAIGSGVSVMYVGLPDLIAMRRAVGRSKDLRRANELEAIVSHGG